MGGAAPTDDWEKLDIPALRGISNTAPYFHNNSATTLEDVVDHYAALSAKNSEDFRPFLLPGAASGFNESARAVALIDDQKRLLGDSGEKAAKETAAAIELKSRIRTRDAASLAVTLADGTKGARQ